MEEIFAAKSRQNICRIFAANNDFPYGKIPAGKIGGGAGGGTRLFPQGKCPAFWLARHHAGRMPAECRKPKFVAV